MAIFGDEGLFYLSRWGHFLFGITWIGVLYYFNFIQGSWFKECGADVKKAATQLLVPRALWWFRWGAMGTFLTGLYMLMILGHRMGDVFFQTSRGIFIMTGAIMGIFMFLNVWLVIWPAQKVVIAAANGGDTGGKDPAAMGAKAALASRTNTLFSIPMLFFMGAAPHLPTAVAPDVSMSCIAMVWAVVIGGLEVNGLCGKMGPMASVSGVITSGMVLTAVLYGILEYCM